MKSKILSLKKAVALRQRDAKKKRRWVFTNGCFDLLHFGHVSYLNAAKKLGDILVVGINRDASVRGLKGSGRPVVSEKHRAALLAALEFIDYVILFGEKTPQKLIEALKPDVLVKGSDWKIEQIAGASFVQSYGGKVKRVRLRPGLSTTKLIEKIKKAY